MNLTTLFNSPISLRFALTLAHFLWQGTVLALLSLILTRVLCKSPARVRYRIHVACLLGMVACVVMTFDWLSRPPTLPTPNPSLPEVVTLGDTARSEPTPIAISPSPTNTSPRAISTDAPVVTQTPPTQSFQWQKLLPYIMGLYWLGVTAMLGRLILGLQGGQRLKRRSRPVEDVRILAALSQQARVMGLSVTPAVAFCSRILVPTVVGVIKPTILLPLAFASNLTPEQMEMILAHELAHIRRLDPLINVLQRFIEAVLFFHPAVWFISYRIRVEREHCCDDLVVQGGAQAEAYAASLLSMAQQALRQPLVEGLAAVKRGSKIGTRVRRVLGLETTESMRLQHTWVATLTVIAILTACLTSLLPGQPPKQDQDPNQVSGINIYLLQDESLTWENCKDRPLDELVLRTEPWIRSEDIVRYDGSSHCMTLKHECPLPFERVSLKGNPFVVTVGNERCYLGSLWTVYSSFLPEGVTPTIDLPNFTSPPNTLSIGLTRVYRPEESSQPIPDVREDSRVIAALKQQDVYHAGLSMSLNSVEVIPDANQSMLTYSYTLTNQDTDPLYVFDPDKMGTALFQAFHNPPTLHSEDPYHHFTAQSESSMGLDEFNQYPTTWFSLLQPGQSQTRTVTAKGYPAIPTGSYKTVFVFNSPGTGFNSVKQTAFDAPVWIGEMVIERETSVSSSVQNLVPQVHNNEQNTRLTDEQWIEQARGMSVPELIEVICKKNGWVTTEQIAAMYRLAELGASSVPQVLSALEVESYPAAKSRLAVTLRMIGDGQAVPGLINALKTCEFCSDYGTRMRDGTLKRFYRKHQINPSDPDVGLGRPVREITISLERLTGHYEGRDHFEFYDEQGKVSGSFAMTPEITEHTQAKCKAVAQRWQIWWDNQQAFQQKPKEIMSFPDSLSLEFHVTAQSDLDLTPTQIKQYQEQLLKEGPYTGSECGDDYQWNRIDPNLTIPPSMITETYRDRTYILLCARQAYSLWPPRQQKPWALTSVTTSSDTQGRSTILIEFDERGAALFGELTANNIGRSLAIIIQGKVVSAPQIMSQIGSKAMITGDFSKEEVERIIIQLKQGITQKTTLIDQFKDLIR